MTAKIVLNQPLFMFDFSTKIIKIRSCKQIEHKKHQIKHYTSKIMINFAI